MKSILMSINPKWVEKIASGEKTIEVRKNRPKLETPFRCYIYMSQGNYKDLFTYGDRIYENRMKVVGEFICDKIEIITRTSDEELQRQTCLTGSEMRCYADDKDIYAWHISELKIYDKPKEIREFYTLCDKVPTEITCRACPNNDVESEFCFNKRKPLTHPPQSWCYVEEQVFKERNK